MKIETLPEAQEAATALADFLVRFNRTLGGLAGRTNGGLDRMTMTTPLVQQPSRAAPETMPERVFAILGDAGQDGLAPIEMVTKYEALGWPGPRKGRLYTALFSSVHYLTKTGKLVKNEHGKYCIAKH